jgi:hypothetical protein
VPNTEDALRRIEEARKSGARKLNLFDLKLSTLREAIGQLPNSRSRGSRGKKPSAKRGLRTKDLDLSSQR